MASKNLAEIERTTPLGRPEMFRFGVAPTCSIGIPLIAGMSIGELPRRFMLVATAMIGGHMAMKAFAVPVFACLLLTLSALGASAARLPDRSHILIVGSSTTYPIVTAAAEHIGRTSGIQTPVVESTGTGGGFKFFCLGEGLDTPDIAMASRRMKQSERENCTRNRVFDIREIRLGYDGIVLASTKHAPGLALSQKDIYLALAREVPSPDNDNRLVSNPYRSWRDIDPTFPDLPIRVLGPPPTSGTRDMLMERVLQPACAEVPALAAMREASPDEFIARCHALREDGAFVNSGENDARLVRKLIQDDQALAVMGYNFLDRNRDRLQAATVDGIAPTFESIETGVYPLTRPLHLYVKPRHQRLVNGLDLFVEALVSAEVSGPEGLLESQGLIPLIDEPDTGRKPEKAAKQPAG